MRTQIPAAILLVLIAGTAGAQVQDQAAAVDRFAQDARGRQAAPDSDAFTRAFAWLASAVSNIGNASRQPVARSPQELLVAFQAPRARIPAEPGSRQP